MLGPRKETAKVGIFGFTGCAGCQLAMLHDEESLLAFVGSAQIVDWLMVNSENDTQCHLDVAVVEGSVNTEQQKKHLLHIRERADLLIAIGHCACSGGVQSMSNGDGNYESRKATVYPDTEITLTKSFEPLTVNQVVKVDYYVPGCPIDATQFQRVFTRAIHGLKDSMLDISVCASCKYNNNECLLVMGQPCMGVLTQTGCGAACPNHGTPCIGCWGPVKDANLKSFVDLMEKHGMTRKETLRRVSMFQHDLVVEQGMVGTPEGRSSTEE